MMEAMAGAAALPMQLQFAGPSATTAGAGSGLAGDAAPSTNARTRAWMGQRSGRWPPLACGSSRRRPLSWRTKRREAQTAQPVTSQASVVQGVDCCGLARASRAGPLNGARDHATALSLPPAVAWRRWCCTAQPWCAISGMVALHKQPVHQACHVKLDAAPPALAGRRPAQRSAWRRPLNQAHRCRNPTHSNHCSPHSLEGAPPWRNASLNPCQSRPSTRT